MAFLSDALGRIKPSPTMAITDRARTLAAQGRDIIALSAGEPDSDTPAHVRAAAKAAIDAGHTRYTAVDGIPALKQAIRDKFARENGLDYEAGEIIVSTGGKQVLYNALTATVNPGDEVIVPAPFWVSYPDIVRLAGGVPVAVTCPAGQGFKLTAGQLEAAITPRSKWLILNSPSNPTGAVYSAAELAALGEVLLRHPQVHVLSDDIYEHLIFGDAGFATLAAVVPALKERCLIVNGVSKAYAMTGWRIGYGAGPRDLVRAMAMLQSQSTSNPCSVSQHAAVAALTGPQDHVRASCVTFTQRRDLVVAGLGACPGLECPAPEGAFYVYPSISGLIGRRSPAGRVLHDDAAFANALLDEAGIAIVPGAAFGLSPYFRISYASATEQLEVAISRIRTFCEGCR